MYTVSQVSRLSGVTPRTLHHYDSLGLLKPSRIGDNGYRYYGEDSILQLQQILMYRELGIELNVIKSLLEAPDFSVIKALESHRKALNQRIERLHRLVETVDRTLAQQKGEIKMTDEELFAGLTDQEISYAKEARERWNPETVRESHRRYGKLSVAEKERLKDDSSAFNRKWATLIGTDPNSAAAQEMVVGWRKGIEFFWTPNLEALQGLADMYVADDRFKANYDQIDPRLAEYIRDCVTAYVKAEAIFNRGQEL